MQYNMLISIRKTEMTQISVEPGKCKLFVYSEITEKVKEAEYLESTLSSHEKVEEKVE